MDSSLRPLCLQSGTIQCGMCERKPGPWGVRAGGRECALRNLKFHTAEMSTGETEIKERSKTRDQLEKGCKGSAGKKNTPTTTTPWPWSFSFVQVQMSSSTSPC